MECIQLSLFGRMYPELSAPTVERTSELCWKSLPAWHSQMLQFLDLRGGGQRWKHAGAIVGDGWSLAWRQLDAQHWGVPQRRKRIALVADFRGGRAAEILFERTGLPGNPDQSIPTWQSIAGLAQDSPAGHDRVVGERSYCISGNTVDRVTYQNGTGVRESGSFTVNTVDRHAVAYSINPLASNSMKSANPNSGFNETKVSRTLDCFDPNPAKNQGGLAIVQPYVLKIRSGCDGGGKGALVQTKRTMTLSTLQDQTLFQPVVFDARGNGDGITVPTITGDHESRVTDYTAIAVDLYNGAVTGDKAAPITCRSIGSHSGPQVAEQRTFSEQAYKVPFSGFAYVQADSKEEAEEKFRDDVTVYKQIDIGDVEEVDEMPIDLD